MLWQKLRAPRAEPSFRASMANFVGAAAAGRHTAPDLVDGLRALAVVEAAMRSADEARRIPLTYPAVTPLIPAHRTPAPATA